MSYNTYITYNGDGSTTDFAIPFTYLKQEDVVVTRQNGPVSFVFLSPNIIRISTPVDVGDVISIERRTNIYNPSVVFNNGSSFTGDNINKSLDQLRYAVQEAIDRTGTVYARVYEVSALDGAFNGVTQTFRLDSGGANLGEKVNDPGFWQITLNGVLLEQVTDYNISLNGIVAEITFVEPPLETDNSQLRFIRFYDGVGGGGGGGGGGATLLDDLDDVAIDNPINGHVLFYNGTTWTNGGSGGTGGGTVDGGGGIDIVTSTPTSCSVAGKPIYNSTDGKLYICKDGVYVDIFEAYTPDAPSPIPIVDTLPAGCTEGQIVLLRTDYKLYTCVGGSWQALIADITEEDILAGLYSSGARPVENVDALPTTGNVEGRLVYLSTNGELYIYKNGAWVLLKDDLTPDAPAGIEVFATNPTTGNYVGRVIFNTTDNKMYSYTSSGWVQVVEPTTAAAEVADGALTTAKFASGIRPVEIVASLPTTDNVEGRLVYLTSDDKLYRYNGTAFVSGTAAADITGQLTSGQLAANSVIAGKIQAGAISATEIAAGAIVADKIAAGAITTTKLAALSISAEKIAASAISSDKIAANAITAGKIQAGAIGTTQLSANAITSDKIASGAIVAGKISAGSIGASEIAALSITGSKIAANAIDATKIQADSITSGLIKAGAIGADQIAVGSIAARHLAADEVLIGTAQIGFAAITTLTVAGNAITQAQAFTKPKADIPVEETYGDIVSGVVTVVGSQPVLIMVSWNSPNQRVTTSTDYDFFVDGQYWRINGYLTGQDARLKMTRTYLDGELPSLLPEGAIPPVTEFISDFDGVTLAASSSTSYSFTSMFTGVPAGTYTLTFQLRRQPFNLGNAVRYANMVMLETKR